MHSTRYVPRSRIHRRTWGRLSRQSPTRTLVAGDVHDRAVGRFPACEVSRRLVMGLGRVSGAFAAVTYRAVHQDDADVLTVVFRDDLHRVEVIDH